MSNLLEEAIVDAKALKEAALKSAQEAILEKYNPEVKKAIQELLTEQEDTDATLDADSDIPSPDPDMDALGAMPQSTGGSLDGQVPMAATNGLSLCPCPDKEIEIDFDQLQQAMSTVDNTSGMTNDMSQKLPAPMSPAEEPVTPQNVATTADQEEEQTPKMPLEEEEIELSEELLNSLLEDEELFQESDMEEELKGGQKKLDVAPPHGKLTAADFAALRKDSDTENEKVEEDIRFQPPQDQIEAIKDSPRKQKASIGASLRNSIATNQLRENKQNKVVLNEVQILAQKTSQLLEEYKKVQSNNKLLAEENARLLKEHAEMQASALEFSKHLQEMSLQNARLFYKNQALSSASLNERQKEKIVEAISKADSVDEVKIIFETLQSAVGSNNTVKEPKSLSEVVTRNSGFNIRSKEKDIPATNPAFDRWARIAGIKR